MVWRGDRVAGWRSDGVMGGGRLLASKKGSLTNAKVT